MDYCALRPKIDDSVLVADVDVVICKKYVCYEYSVFACLASDIDLKMNFIYICLSYSKRKILKMYENKKKVTLELPNLDIYNEKNRNQT